ncbi:arylacetamide deacetylase-like 4 [Ahaetulla prasina]|uniref:arylacetamide deacetylase-like 4 n=1 Tax=Ahaetulla prasina TaxID=499056 RepID=UPI002649A468|nr:arylacetamide deacetylase-like 4 [Ahaetulla prasina]
MYIPPGIRQEVKLQLLYLSIGFVLRLIAFLWISPCGFFLNFCTEQASTLEKLDICREFAVVKFLVDGIFLVGPCDLSIKEMLFDTVPVRLYRCKTSNPEKRRGLVWIHGGAGLFGSLSKFSKLFHWFSRLGNFFLTPCCLRYPLAPEHPYPAQQRSCYAAVSYFLEHAQDFGVDPQRIVLGGDSSGGSVVAAISQQLVFRKDLPQVRAHVLIYPYLQGVDFNLPSYQQNQSVPLLLMRDMIRFGKFYLTGKSSDVDGVMANAHVPEHLRAKYQKWISAELIPEEFKVRGYVPFVPGRFSEDLFKECERAFDPMFSPLLMEDAVLRRFPEMFVLWNLYFPAIRTCFDPGKTGHLP